MADGEQGLASGLVNTSVQIGGAVVLAVVSAILSGAASVEVPACTGQLIPGMVGGLQVIVGITAVGVIASFATVARRRRRSPQPRLRRWTDSQGNNGGVCRVAGTRHTPRSPQWC